jgi:hypothetical protein
MFRIWQLVSCEYTGDVGAAIAPDKQLKRWARQKKIALVESINPKWEDSSVEKAEKSRLAARDPSTAVGMMVWTPARFSHGLAYGWPNDDAAVIRHQEARRVR